MEVSFYTLSEQNIQGKRIFGYILGMNAQCGSIISRISTIYVHCKCIFLYIVGRNAQCESILSHIFIMDAQSKCIITVQYKSIISHIPRMNVHCKVSFFTFLERIFNVKLTFYISSGLMYNVEE